MIKFDNVVKSFGDKTVLKGISFEIKKGENFFIVGLSGAGKSVTLKHMIRLLKPTEGVISFDGQDITYLEGRALEEMRSRFGYLFQSSALLQWLTVAGNVGLPLHELTKMTEEEIREKVDDTLDKVGLLEARDRLPSNISGGMQKRAGLARAIVTEPEMILYDEPTSGLDPVTSRTIDELIDSLRKRLGVTSIVVTHDMISALTIGSRIAMLHLGEVVEISEPKEFLKSTHPIVRDFLDSQYIPEDFLERNESIS